MFGDPMHPAVVHFPIVLALLLPLVVLVSLILIKRGAPARPTWGVVLGVAALLFFSSWLSVRTGEDQEDRVEEVVAEAPLESHEEAGERFLVLSGVGLVLVILGFAPGRIGKGVQLLAIPASLGMAALVVDVGHSGGELVYRHGAAAAYTEAGANGGGIEGAEEDDDDEGEDDDD